MKKNLLLALLAFLAMACGRTNEPVVDLVQEVNGFTYSKKATLEANDQYTIMLDNNTGFYQRSIRYTQMGDKEVFSFLNRLNNALYLYEFPSGEPIKKIPLATEGPNGVGLMSVADHVITEDGRLLIYNVNTGILYQLNMEGAVERKYELFDIKGEQEQSYPNPTLNRQMVLVDNKVHIPCEILFRKDDYSNVESLLTVDLETGASEYSLPFSDTYSMGFWGAIFKHQPSVTYNPNKNKFLVGFPVDPNLYWYTPGEELNEGTYIGSEFIDKLSPLTADIGYGTRLDPNKRDNRSYEYSLTSSDYSRVEYDPYQGVYYRFVCNRPNIERFSAGDKSPEYSIIIADEGLNKIGEVRMEKERYNTPMAFATKAGLAIPRLDLYGENEDRIVFDIFEVKSNDNALASTK